MKIIKLKNSSLINIFTFLQATPLKNRASLGKIKFMKKLQEKEQDLVDAKKEIQEDYFQKDDEGNLKVIDGQYVFKDDVTDDQKKELTERMEILLDEEFEIGFVEYSAKYEAMFEALEDLDKELDGEEALAYFDLMEAYEKTNEKGE